jgi:hypothetical protein
VRSLRLAALSLLITVPVALAGCSSSKPPAKSSSTSSSGAFSTTTLATSATTTTSTTQNTNCQPSQLQVSPQPSNGAAGTIELSITLTNTSAVTCQMLGYPGMLMLAANGDALPTNVVRGGGANFVVPAAMEPPSLVSLAPGSAAAFSLNYSDVTVDNESSCPTSTSVEVTPPNDMAFATVGLALDPCGGGTIHVSPIYSASS